MLRVRPLRKTTYSFLAATLLAPSIIGFAAAQDAQSKVASSIEAFTIVTNQDGAELRTPADTVSPGGIIEYQMTYKNVSQDSLSDFIIQGEVPQETYFVSSNDLVDMPAVFEVSVADIGWATPPVIRYVEDEEGILRPVTVPDEEFEALRWRLAEPISPGEEVSATYRIRVED